MKPALRSLMIAAAIICAQSAAFAQEDVVPIRTVPGGATRGTGSISGRVVLPSGQPVSERVRIILSSTTNPGVTYYTDNNGGFGFVGLGEGLYTIEATGDPRLYEAVTQEVRLIRGMHVKLVINLKEKTPAANNKPSGNVVSVSELDQNVPAAAKKEYDKATRLANEDKLAEAIVVFKKAIVIYPSYLMALNDLGVQYLKLKRFSEAAEQFEAAVDVNPKAFNPRLNLGMALVEQKKFTNALDHLRLASSIYASSPALHLYLGIALVETDELDSARPELEKAISMGGAEFSVAHYFLAHVHLKTGERDEAMREFKTYLEKEPAGKYAVRAKMLLEQLK